MNKLLIALAAALFAIPTLLASSAEAGGRGGFRVFHNPAFHMVRKYHSDDYGHAPRKAKRRVKRKKSYTAKKRAPKAVAKAEQPKPKAPVKAAESENSSISTGDGKVAQTKADKPAEAKVAQTKTGETKTVADARDLGCKKFFATVGMTLSVPCE